jgi:hypothetical protein
MAKNPAHQLAALQRAYDSGHPEIALMILAGKVRVYTRDNTPKGWPADYHKPYPQGTAAVVLMDTYPDGEPGAYYIVPIADIRRIITEQFHRDFPGGPDSRPRTPGAGHDRPPGAGAAVPRCLGLLRRARRTVVLRDGARLVTG